MGKSPFRIRLDSRTLDNVVKNASLGLLNKTPDGQGSVSQWNNHVSDERQKKLEASIAAIQADTTLDDFTRQELLTGMDKKNLDERLAVYETAKKGEGVYKERKLAEERIKAIKEQPGRKQTFLTGGGNSSSGGESGTFLTGLT